MNIKHKPISVKIVIACLASALLGGTIVYFAVDSWSAKADGTAQTGDEDGHDESNGESNEHDEGSEGELIKLPKEMWEASRLKIEPAQRRTLMLNTWTTGKVTLNQNRSANIYSITEGLAHEVLVDLGAQVEEGQVIAIIDSREVGTAKLELYQARLKEEFSRQANEFAQQVTTNANALIEALASNASTEKIKTLVGDKPIGNYREQLLSAYAELTRSRADYDRIKPIASSGAVPGSKLIEVEASLRSAEARFDAVLEQLRFSIPQDALRTEQSYREALQAVDVAKAKLSILGYTDEQLADLKPDAVGTHISHYEVKAPFSGTVIAKNVVLAERVGTDTEMFQIADLATVWIQADIYQKDLSIIDQLGDTLRFRPPLGNGDSIHLHAAKIFYRGDIIDPETRTLRLRAVAENADRHLKSGMFVEIEIPGSESADVLAVPESAIQEIDDQKLVFVQAGEITFRKAEVVIGAMGNSMVEIKQGLQVGDRVVTAGAFALKSELMKGEISHGH